MKELRDWVDVGFKLVLAVVGVVVGYYFSFQRQQNDDIKLVVDLATAEQPEKRLLGASLAAVYTSQKRIPQDFYVSLYQYANNSNDQKFRDVVNADVVSVVKNDTTLQTAVGAASASLPVRIYFHIRRQEDRGAAEDLGRKIASSVEAGADSIVVPGVQFVAGRQDTSILKCFKAAECKDLGPRLVKLFVENGVPMELSDQSRQYETSTAIRPKHFEAWFARLGT